jgi:hypothetical protein
MTVTGVTHWGRMALAKSALCCCGEVSAGRSYKPLSEIFDRRVRVHPFRESKYDQAKAARCNVDIAVQNHERSFKPADSIKRSGHLVKMEVASDLNCSRKEATAGSTKYDIRLEDGSFLYSYVAC